MTDLKPVEGASDAAAEGAQGAPTLATRALDEGAQPTEADTTALPTAAASPHDTETEATDETAVFTPPVEWIPATPKSRTRRRVLWIGVPTAVVVAALVTSSLVLIAPGTAIAGVPIGGLTAGAATDAIQKRLDHTAVTLSGPGGGVTVTGSQLGAAVDARALAQSAYAEHPMWNVGAWFAHIGAPQVRLDSTKAVAALRRVVPSLFVAPHDALVAFDAATQKYVVKNAVAGSAVDLTSLQSAFAAAFAKSTGAVTVAPASVAVQAAVTTAHATKTAISLNTMLDTVGFYVGDERTVPVDRAVAASWITLKAQPDGTISVRADAAAIQKAVDGLPAAVNRAAVDGAEVTNSSGTVLRTIAAGQSARTLGDTSGVAAAFAAQLATLDGAYKLPVTETAAGITKQQYLIEVNTSTQRLYLKVNGQVVDTWLISSGRAVSPTWAGHFRINSHIPVQTMRGDNLDGTPYVQPNVPWVMYFNGSEGFHGVYWHTGWGIAQSHGCVGMPIFRAKQLYDWTPAGTDVWIHS